MPFIYNGSLHMMTWPNPPLVIRLPEAQTWDDDVVTEVVSRPPKPVQWRYGTMRGGTNAVFDAELGGYVTFFHSSVVHDVNGHVGCKEHKRTYYMGCAVYAAQPPFAVQQMTPEPLACEDMYGETCGQKGWYVVFPLGLIITPDAFIVSCGINDASTSLLRFDRTRLMELLQPPVPAAWDGKLTTSC